MLRKIFAFVTLAFIINFSVTFAAQSSILPASVVDTANVLTEQEINSLARKIQSVEQKHQIKIGVEFLKTIMGKDERVAADSLLDKNFVGAKNGSILLLVVMDTRKWHISTNTLMMPRIPDTSMLADNFLGDLSAGDYYSAATNYIDGVDKYLTYYEQNGTPYDPTGEFDILSLGFSIIFSIVCGIMFRSSLIDSMSNVQPAISAADYLKRDSVKITEKSDKFLYKNVSRRTKSRSSSSSSHSSGGSSHGGSGGSF